MELSIFQLRVINSKVKQKSLTMDLVTQSYSFFLFDFELVISS